MQPRLSIHNLIFEYNLDMYILENVPLNAYSTMRLGGNAAYLTEVNSREEVAQAVEMAFERQMPVIMIGGGSNIVWSDAGFQGLVLVNKIQGIEMQSAGETERYVTAGGGVTWDEFVAYTTERDMTGIEFLSLIPGTVGATPIQNVGAYGQEVGSTIVTIEAYDKQEHKFVTLPGSECNFSYRNSRFKGDEKGRFFITAVTFFLNVGNPTPPFYGAVEQYCKDNGISTLTPKVGRDAVMAIRTAKLPDPRVIANNGSFFANPIISADKYFTLHDDFPEIAHWPVDDKHVKLSAAWLIEQAGFKDFHDPETGMATWYAQPLVLVNEKATSTASLLQFKQKIVGAVEQKFGITLVQEPELIGQ